MTEKQDIMLDFIVVLFSSLSFFQLVLFSYRVLLYILKCNCATNLQCITPLGIITSLLQDCLKYAL